MYRQDTIQRQHVIHRRPDGSIDSDRHCRQVRRMRIAAWRLALARLRRRFGRVSAKEKRADPVPARSSTIGSRSLAD